MHVRCEAGYACRAQCGSFPCAVPALDSCAHRHFLLPHCEPRHSASGDTQASCKGAANTRPCAWPGLRHRSFGLYMALTVPRSSVITTASRGKPSLSPPSPFPPPLHPTTPQPTRASLRRPVPDGAHSSARFKLSIVIHSAAVEKIGGPGLVQAPLTVLL